MYNPLQTLSQEELFRVLRHLLKNTKNVLLPHLAEQKRVQALFSAIQLGTWKEACEKHFDLNLSQETNKECDPKDLYLSLYPKNRLEA